MGENQLMYPFKFFIQEHKSKLCQSLLLFLLGIGISGCSQESLPPEPVPTNDIVQAKRFWRVDTEEDLGSAISIKQGEGFYAVIEMKPIPDRPKTLKEVPVSDPRLWLCVAICYPKGKTFDDEQAIQFPVHPLYAAQSPKYALFPIAPPGPQENLPQYNGELKLHYTSQPKEIASRMRKEKSEYLGSSAMELVDGKMVQKKATVLKHQFDDDVVPCSLFLGATHSEPGEYVLEIHTFPCFAGLKPEGSPLGPPVILYRGTVTFE